MKNYELLCILPGTLAEDEVAPLVEKVEEIVKKNGGENIKFEDLGKNRLAYPMKHIRYGYFRLFLFESEEKNIPEIQGKLKLVTQLLRSLISVYDPSKRKEGKINYVTDQSGIVTMTKDMKKQKKVEDAPGQAKEDNSQETPEVKQQKEGKKVDLKEIDEQLDKILETDIGNV